MHSFKDVGLLLENIYTYGGISVHLILPLSLFSTLFLFWLYSVTCGPTQALGSENAESSPLGCPCMPCMFHFYFLKYLFI